MTTDGGLELSFMLHRLSSAGDELWSLNRHGTVNPFAPGDPRLGTVPHEIAASATGRIAVVGEYSGLSYEGAWVQVFSP